MESGGADELPHVVAAVIDFWWGHLSRLTGAVKFNGWCSIEMEAKLGRTVGQGVM